MLEIDLKRVVFQHDSHLSVEAPIFVDIARPAPDRRLDVVEFRRFGMDGLPGRTQRKHHDREHQCRYAGHARYGPRRRLYRTLGFELIRGGDGEAFTSLRAGTGFLNLVAHEFRRL